MNTLFDIFVPPAVGWLDGWATSRDWMIVIGYRSPVVAGSILMMFCCTLFMPNLLGDCSKMTSSFVRRLRPPEIMAFPMALAIP